MKFKLFTFSILVAMGIPAHADDLAIAAKLEALGGKIGQKNGVVTEVSFRNSKELGADEFQIISELSGLRKLTVYGHAAGLNDETVGLLSKLKSLESLSVDGAQLSDAGLEKIADVKSLQSVSFFHLSFRKEGFTGSGFSTWKTLPTLKKLTVAGMSMGDDGFAAISEIKTLTDFRTWHTYRTDASHVMLAKLPNLTSLKLGQRLPGSERPQCLTDASLKTIATMTALTSLEIGESRFSFNALKQLKALPELKKLKIVLTKIELGDIESLKTELPNVEVIFEPLTDEQRKRLEGYLK